MNNDKITYVYRGTEVILTGRKASRQLSPSTRRSSSSSQIHEEFLYEIVPADPKNGSWSSWIKKEELFVIIDPTEEKHLDENVQQNSM